MDAPDTPPRPRGSAAPMVIVVGAVALFGAFALALVLLWSSEGDRAGAAQASADDAALREVLDSMTIPEFSARAQDGREFSRDDLEGHWTVLSFGFTHCTLVCPIMHGQMFRLQEMLGRAGMDGGDVRILAISVDPENDTVERLGEYANRMQADPRLWTFARTEPDDLDRIMVQGLGLGTSRDPARQIDMGGGRTMDDIVHSSRVLVVAPDLRVVGMYRGTDPADIDRMVGDLRRWVEGEPGR